MKFSVVIPLYNGAGLIAKTLDTVLAQSYKDYEVVLVNDGSPDRVGAVVQEYMAAHPQAEYRYLEQANKGLGGARNLGISRACGEIIAILDQDDLWHPDKLAWVAEVFAADPAADVVYHNARIVKDGQIDGVYVMGQADQTDMLRQLIFKGNNLATLATCFRKKLIDSVGYFSEEKAELHLVEDYDLWLRMAAAGCKFVFLPQILADYVMHDSNYSAGNIELMCRSELFVLERHYQALKNKHRFDWYRFRRRRGQILAFAAYRFLLAADRPNSYRYLVKAVAADPLTMVLVAKRLLNRAWRRIFSKGAIG